MGEINAKDCSNLAKEYNGERNWCLLRDTHCPLLVKHERYAFDKRDLTCGYLDSLNENETVKEVSSKKCRGCKKIFKTDNYRLQYCSDVCKKIAKRDSNRMGKKRKTALIKA